MDDDEPDGTAARSFYHHGCWWCRLYGLMHRVHSSYVYKHAHHASHMCYLGLFAMEHEAGPRVVLAIALILCATIEWLDDGESE